MDQLQEDPEWWTEDFESCLRMRTIEEIREMQAADVQALSDASHANPRTPIHDPLDPLSPNFDPLNPRVDWRGMRLVIYWPHLPRSEDWIVIPPDFNPILRRVWEARQIAQALAELQQAEIDDAEMELAELELAHLELATQIEREQAALEATIEQVEEQADIEQAANEQAAIERVELEQAAQQALAEQAEEQAAIEQATIEQAAELAQEQAAQEQAAQQAQEQAAQQAQEQAAQQAQAAQEQAALTEPATPARRVRFKLDAEHPIPPSSPRGPRPYRPEATLASHDHSHKTPSPLHVVSSPSSHSHDHSQETPSSLHVVSSPSPHSHDHSQQTPSSLHVVSSPFSHSHGHPHKTPSPLRVVSSHSSSSPAHSFGDQSPPFPYPDPPGAPRLAFAQLHREPGLHLQSLGSPFDPNHVESSPSVPTTKMSEGSGGQSIPARGSAPVLGSPFTRKPTKVSPSSSSPEIVKTLGDSPVPVSDFPALGSPFTPNIARRSPSLSGPKTREASRGSPTSTIGPPPVHGEPLARKSIAPLPSILKTPEAPAKTSVSVTGNPAGRPCTPRRPGQLSSAPSTPKTPDTVRKWSAPVGTPKTPENSAGMKSDDIPVSSPIARGPCTPGRPSQLSPTPSTPKTPDTARKGSAPVGTPKTPGNSTGMTSEEILVSSPIGRGHPMEVSPPRPFDPSLLPSNSSTEFNYAYSIFHPWESEATPTTNAPPSDLSGSEETSAAFDRVSSTRPNTGTAVDVVALDWTRARARSGTRAAVFEQRFRKTPSDALETRHVPPTSPTSNTDRFGISGLCATVIHGKAEEERLSGALKIPGLDTEEVATAAAETTRRPRQAGLVQPIVLVEWYFAGRSWDDIPRDTEDLQLQLSSHNIISPKGTPYQEPRIHPDDTPKSSRVSSRCENTQVATPSIPRNPPTPSTTQAPRAGTGPPLTAALRTAMLSTFLYDTEDVEKTGNKSTDTDKATCDAEIPVKEKSPVASPEPEKAPEKASKRFQWPKRKTARASSGEEGGFDRTFHLYQLQPLPQFRELRSLKLTQMVVSHQADIWLAVWVNLNLKTLTLEMKEEPRCTPQIGSIDCTIIEMGWHRRQQTDGRSFYLGEAGTGRLPEKYGGGEYLDREAMQKAKVRAMAMGYYPETLPVVDLTLSGFVVDSGPFVSWFGDALRSVHLKKNCVDAGFWLPTRMAAACSVRHCDSEEVGVVGVSKAREGGRAATSGNLGGFSEWFGNAFGPREEDEDEVDAIVKPLGLVSDALRGLGLGHR